MTLVSDEIKTALNDGKYVRREGYISKSVCYHLAYDGTLECGYITDGSFKPCEYDSDRFGLMYEDIFEDDWLVM